MTNVLALNIPATKPRSIKATRKASRALSRQAYTAVLVGGTAVAITGLSLAHLAHGVEIITHSPAWQSWAMAVGIDIGFIATELATITVTDKLRKAISRFAKPAILGKLATSAAMNAFAFAKDVDGIVMTTAAIALGVAIPALIYALTRVGAALWIDTHSKG